MDDHSYMMTQWAGTHSGKTRLGTQGGVSCFLLCPVHLSQPTPPPLCYPPQGSACLCWGLARPDPGPGVMTMRRTLKRDIPQLLTQHGKKKINGLCITEEQWKAFSHQKKILTPVPSVSILLQSQTSQPALCGHSWTRITQSMCPPLDNTQSQPPV